MFMLNFVFFVTAKVIIDRDSGRSRGFGFVNFSDEDCAKEAMNAMDGQVETSYHKTVLCSSLASTFKCSCLHYNFTFICHC